MSQCAYCHRETPRTYRVTDPDGYEEQVCLECKRDVDLSARKGKEPAEP